MVDITTYQNIGSRDYQEDRMVVIPKFGNVEHFVLCLVCDGHGGEQAASFLIEEYPKQLATVFDQYRQSKKQYKKMEKTKQKDDEQRVVRMMGLALERCILLWDYKCFGEDAKKIYSDEMRPIFKDPKATASFFAKHYDEEKWEKQGLRSGCTFNCMVLDLKKCRAYLVNLGDSRTTWIIGDDTIGQTIDHTVKRKLAANRGVECKVIEGRLEGVLLMTHAFGDNDDSVLGRVNREYATKVVNFKGKSFRSVTASDGLFDFRSNHQVLYDVFENAQDIAKMTLREIYDEEISKRADLVKKGLMDVMASQTPFTPKFEDNVSIIYVKIPADYKFKKTKKEDDTSELLAQLSFDATQKKNSKKKSSSFIQSSNGTTIQLVRKNSLKKGK